MVDIKSGSKNSLNNKIVRSFGRIKSRKLSDHKNHLYNDLLPKYNIDFSSKSVINKENCNILEIGFGFGDFLFENTKKNQDQQFFGFEPHINGVVNLLKLLEKDPLENIKISIQDIRLYINEFPDNFFDKIYILFADPWPKLKHYKRRLINIEFLDKILYPKMKKKADLILATDHDSYKIWILSQILESKNFEWQVRDKKSWQNFPKDWTYTKYQKKATLQNRDSIIINLKCL